MDKELFEQTFEMIKEKEQLNNAQIGNIYDILASALNDIKSFAFPDMTDGKLTIMPYGDFITNTYYDNCFVEFLIIYQTNRDNIDFSTPFKRITKKGKVKLSTYRQIVDSPTNQGVMQAEEITNRFADNLKKIIAPSQKVYSKYNTIMVKINSQVNAKITVCYDANFDKNELLVRRINSWTYINPMKYLEKIENKDKETNHNFSTFVKIFKALEIELILSGDSKLLIGKNHFVENLLYNVPTELFIDKDNLVIMNNILFYLKNENPRNLKLIDETYNALFDEKSYYEKKYYKQYINKINYAFENFDIILDKTLNRDDE